ncbi:MAG: serine/threonine-protein kinase [Planctomycetota bacterium]|nr:serine/threonine-protein kinase [Planctomycetota bacterium]
MSISIQWDFNKTGEQSVALDINERDLICGALALAYAYIDIETLHLGLQELCKPSNKAPGLVPAFRGIGKMSPERGAKLERSTTLMLMLRDAAIYGTIALNNKLIGEDMLNACMEENRRKGFKKDIGTLLQEKGVLTPTLHKAIAARCEDVLKDISGPQAAIKETIQLDDSDKELTRKKIEMLFGETASKLSFLTRERIEDYLKDDSDREKGVPVRGPKKPKEQTPAEVISGDEPIKGYEIVKKLGQGAMGAVYRAVRASNGETVALKVLKPDLSNDQEFVQRFLREAKAVARLNHPNVIRAIDVGKSGKYYYFAMEFIDGQAIGDVVKRTKNLPERAALKVVKQIALALDHAWKHKIIHRDVKPDNIMVMKNGTAKLTDLGLARTARESTLTLTGVVMGSPAYISPEQATGEKNLDTRSDIYSLGATLFHLLTGCVPYDGDSPLQVMLRHMNDPLPDVRKKVPTVSEGTRQLIFKMMAKRPESRFQNAKQLYDAILSTEKLLAGTSIEELSRSQAAMRRHKPAGLPSPSGKSGPLPVPSPSASGATKGKAPSGKSSGGNQSDRLQKGKKSKSDKSSKSKADSGKKAELRERMKKLKKRRI